MRPQATLARALIRNAVILDDSGFYLRVAETRLYVNRGWKGRAPIGSLLGKRVTIRVRHLLIDRDGPVEVWDATVVEVNHAADA